MASKFLIKLSGVNLTTHGPEMFSDHRMFMLLYALICIADITCEFVYCTLLVDQGRLSFCDSQMSVGFCRGSSVECRER